MKFLFGGKSPMEQYYAAFSSRSNKAEDKKPLFRSETGKSMTWKLQRPAGSLFGGIVSVCFCRISRWTMVNHKLDIGLGQSTVFTWSYCDLILKLGPWSGWILFGGSQDWNSNLCENFIFVRKLVDYWQPNQYKHVQIDMFNSSDFALPAVHSVHSGACCPWYHSIVQVADQRTETRRDVQWLKPLQRLCPGGREFSALKHWLQLPEDRKMENYGECDKTLSDCSW